MAREDIPTPPYPIRVDNSVERLSRLQAELVSEALKRAVDDACSAMAHQLSEPLTALLLYLNEIKQVGGQAEGTPPAASSLGEIVDRALRETDRVCEIVRRIGGSAEAHVDADAAIARGRDAIHAWALNGGARTGDATSPVPPGANTHPLTPRERQVLALIAGGCSNKEGGHRLGISTRTFEAHRAQIMWKCGARNAADLMRKTLNHDR
jgi:DNA-binding CsgD family transcriptional regulator